MTRRGILGLLGRMVSTLLLAACNMPVEDVIVTGALTPNDVRFTGR